MYSPNYWMKIIFHKRRQLWGQLSLSLTKSLLSITKVGRKGKNFHPLGVVLRPFLAELRSPPSLQPGAWERWTGCTRRWLSRPQWCWLDGTTWERWTFDMDFIWHMKMKYSFFMKTCAARDALCSFQHHGIAPTYIGLCHLDKGSKYQVSWHHSLRIPSMRQASRR